VVVALVRYLGGHARYEKVMALFPNKEYKRLKMGIKLGDAEVSLLLLSSRRRAHNAHAAHAESHRC